MADGSVIIDTLLDPSGLKRGLAAIGGTLVASAGAIAALGVAAVKTGIEFESAFAGVVKTVDATDEQLATMRDGILDMSTEIPIAATEIAGIAEAAGQLGIATDDILSFTGVMADLGVATNLTSEEAATALARMANITGMASEDYSRLGSTIVALGNNFATTESEIVDMATNLASMGTSAGMSETDILALSTAMSSVGIEAAAGGTAMSTFISTLQLAVETGSDDLANFAAVAGMTADEFSTAFRDDAAGAVNAFMAGLGKMDESGVSAIAVLDDLGITETRQRNMLLSLANASGVLDDALTTANEAWEEDTALANEAAQRYKTVESQITMLKNGVSALGVAVYDELRPALVDTIGFAGDMVNQLRDGMKEGGLEGLVSAAGDVLAKVVTKVAEAAPQLIGAATKLITSFLQGIQQNAPAIAKAAVDIGASLIDGIITIIPQLLVTGAQLIAEFGIALMEALPDIVNSLIENLVDFIQNSVPLIIEAGINLLTALVEGLPEVIIAICAALPQIIDAILTVLLDSLPLLIDAGIRLFVSLVEALPEIIAAICDAIPQIIDAVLQALIEATPQLVEAGVNLFIALITNLPAIITAILEGVFQIIGAIINKLVDSWPQMVKAGGEILKKIGEGIKAGIKGIVEIGKSIVTGIWNGISSGWQWLTSKVKNLAKNLLSAAKSALGISSPSKLFRDVIGKNIVLGIDAGLTDNVDQLEATMGRIGNKMANTKLGAKLATGVSAEVGARTSRISPSGQGSSSMGEKSEPFDPADVITEIRRLRAEVSKGKTIVADKKVLGKVVTDEQDKNSRMTGK